MEQIIIMFLYVLCVWNQRRLWTRYFFETEIRFEFHYGTPFVLDYVLCLARLIVNEQMVVMQI